MSRCVELETDKANVDLPSPAAGVLTRVKAEGAKVRIGETIATIDPNGSVRAQRPLRKPPADASVCANVFATCAAHRVSQLRPANRRFHLPCDDWWRRTI